MNRDRIAGRWRQLKLHWMLGTIQTTDGATRQASEKQLADWSDSQHKNDPIHK